MPERPVHLQHGLPSVAVGRLVRCHGLCAQLMAEGLSTKAIASHLYLSPKTIESHRQHMMEKLDAHSIADLVKYAVREGLTTL